MTTVLTNGAGLEATVIYAHEDVDLDDLAAYLTDSIRSEAMLAIDDGLLMDGPFFRGRSVSQESCPEPEDLLTSWAGGRFFASMFGKHVRTVDRLRVIAMVSHPDGSGGWIEYVGWVTA